MGNSEQTFTTTGFCDWKKITEKLNKHVNSEEHKKCMEKWNSYNISKTSGSVAMQISNAHQKEVSENKLYIEKIFSIMIYLCSQGLAIRGHDQSKNSNNQGNFLELCNLFSKFDSDFNNKFNNTFSLYK